MSVTFAPEYKESDIIGWTSHCQTTDTCLGVEQEYATAVEVAAFHTLACDDCHTYGMYVGTFTMVPEGVNMANRNARYVMELLGLEFGDGSGIMDADAFAGHLAFADVIGRGDRGTDTVSYLEDGGARMHDCGRAVGYADRKLDDLAELVEWCRANGRQVQWS